MKYTVVSVSRVMEGNGCMLPSRFLDKCGECNIVMRCPNEQAKRGRIQYLKTRRSNQMVKVDKTNAILSREIKTQVYGFIKRLLSRGRAK